MKTRIALLYGGKSGEHDVSRISAASVASALNPENYETLYIGIDHDGRWFLQDSSRIGHAIGEPSGLPIASSPETELCVIPGNGLCLRMASEHPIAMDLVFPVLHGTFGEDGTVQGLLEVAGIPYIGAGVLGSALGMDKEFSKSLWMLAGLPVVPFLTATHTDIASPKASAAFAERASRAFGWPLFVKPSRAGSSVGSAKATSPEDLAEALHEAFRFDSKALVEPFKRAREVECSIVGNVNPVAFDPGEVVPHHEFYDYDAKYIDPDGAALIIPAKLPPETRERVKDIAKMAYKACQAEGMARVDFFVGRDDNEILLNEINTIPGFTGISMFPKMCASGGLSYPALIDKLVSLALERHAERAALAYRR